MEKVTDEQAVEKMEEVTDLLQDEQITEGDLDRV
jgi:hypothetical protein